MLQKKTVIWLVTVLLTILITGCNTQHEENEVIDRTTSYENRERVIMSMHELGLEEIHVHEIEGPPNNYMLTCERLRGYVDVALLQDNNENIIDYQHEEGFIQINLETPQDQIVVSLFNACHVDRPILVKVFFNYEETPFRVAGSEIYFDDLLLKVSSGHVVNIPINLSSNLEKNEYLNILSIGAFPNPEHHTMKDDSFTISNMFGEMHSWAISYGGSERLKLDVPFMTPPTRLVGIESFGLVVQQYGQAWSENHGVYLMSEQHLQVKSGDTVDLYFYINPGSLIPEWRETVVTEYLIVAMLNWQQIQLNALPFLRVEAIHEEKAFGITDRGHFTIIAPEEPGLYEFVAFIIFNPIDIHDDVHHWGVQFTFPFTIEVTKASD